MYNESAYKMQKFTKEYCISMKKNEIIKLLEETKPVYESVNLDFKKAEDLSKSLFETVSAFANTNGGSVLLGIYQRKDKTLKYIGIQAAENQESKIRDNFKNKMINLLEEDFQISIMNFKGWDLPIIQIHIKAVRDERRKPVYIKNLGMHKGAFIRIGQRDEIMPAYMIDDILMKKMIIDKKLPRPELQLVDSSSINDLDNDLIKKYAKMIKKTGVILHESDTKQFNNFLFSKNILIDNKITKFGMLTFGKEPEKYLPYQATVQVSDDTGIDILKGERGKNKEMFEGDILTLIQETLDWCKTNLPTARVINKDGESKEDIIIPITVLREIIVNAFCHKDYTQDEKVVLKIKDKHLTIENPGLLKYDIYHNNFIIPGKTKHQNPLIVKYLFRSILAEGEGKGFTLLLQSCLVGSIDIPIITLDFSGRVLVEISSQNLFNQEIKTWLETKKHLIKVSLNDTDKKLIAYLYKAHDLIRSEKFIINLSEECLNRKQKISLTKLLQNKIIKEEILGSTKIFRLTEEILKNDYSKELIEVFGKDYFSDLEAQNKQILSYVMQFEMVNMASSASKLTRLLYPNTPEDKLSDAIARGIRHKCNFLLKKGFLTRDESIPISSPKGNLRINYDFKKNKLAKEAEPEKTEAKGQKTLI